MPVASAPGRRRRGRLATRAIVAAALLAGGALAGELPPPARWAPLTFPKVERRTHYAAATVDGRAAVRADSDCAASALVVATPDVDLARTPHLTWAWKVERGLLVADERGKAGDDFAARVWVMFQFDPARASAWQRLRHAIASRLHGRELPGAAISYVWSSREPIGASWEDPFGAGSQRRVLRSGPPDGWQRESVDVAADYRALVGGAPPPLLGVALMSDTDNTCQQAVALFADFAWSP